MSVKKVILLTSVDNFVWTSMQEIIPMIEFTWKDLCNDHNYLLKTIDADKFSLSKFMKDLIESDLIVVTCFNSKIARVIKIIREELKIDTKICFYLHGLATIALWPLNRFGILPLLNSNDIFVGTCDGDLKSLQLSLTNSRSLKIAFTLNDFKMPVNNPNSEAPIVYIGRISPQKNLDSLILGYSKIEESLKHKFPLYLYGKEDNLGYPNVGIVDYHYLEKLKKLVIDLRLEKFVFFKGFVERHKIQEELGTNYTFISPSTHSDENFGMAAFRALLTGVPCILSRWGGHIEFENTFKNKITWLHPENGRMGPRIAPEEIADAIRHSLTNKHYSVEKLPSQFSSRKIKNLLNEAINIEVRPESLIPTSLALTIFEQQKNFEKDSQLQRCFNSFKDPGFSAFLEAYL